MKVRKLKADEFQSAIGIVPKEFTRAVKINDLTTNLKVVLKMNHKKLTFEVISAIQFSQVTGDENLDSSLLESLASLQMLAMKEGLKWRADLMKERGIEEDPDQMTLSFSDEEEGQAASG